MNRSSKILAVALMAAAAPWLVTAATATPLSQSMGLQNAVAPSVETVHYSRGWHGGYWGGYRAGPYRYYGYGLGYAYAPSYGYGYRSYGYGYRPGHLYEFDRQLCCHD
jgi:hypothetical protein